MAKRRRRATPRPARTQARAARSSVEKVEQVDFAEEYSYVVGDLKRIAILALAMFGALIVLALIIQ